MPDEESQAELPEGEAQVEESAPTPEEQVALDDAQTEETTADEPKEEPAEKPKPKRGFQKRISGLTEKVRELQAKVDEQEALKAAPEIVEPTLDDYPDYEQYLEARAKWAAETRFSELQSQTEARQQDRERQTNERQSEERWDVAQDAAREKYDDFDDVVYGEVNITEPMAAAVKQVKDGADIAYYLGKHPAEAERIAKLDPITQIASMGAIGERLKERPNVKPLPKPITRGKTSSSSAPAGLSDSMPIGQWIKARNKQAGRS